MHVFCLYAPTNRGKKAVFLPVKFKNTNLFNFDSVKALARRQLNFRGKYLCNVSFSVNVDGKSLHPKQSPRYVFKPAKPMFIFGCFLKNV